MLAPRRAPGSLGASLSRWLPIVTVLTSCAALLAVVLLAGNWLEVHLVFSGERPAASPSQITTYRVWASVAVAAVLGGATTHLLDRNRRMYGAIWQALLALAVAATVALAYIPGAVNLSSPDVEGDHPLAPPCYSGGDSDECLGG